ncbi:Serine--tRNA ligase [uncultured archaeon]|nr:Serine--tRNA ligase [uncultured archaeon]
MLDINLIRDDPARVKENIHRRGDAAHLKRLNELVDLDALWKQKKKEVEALRARRNKLSDEIKVGKKDGRDVSAVFEEAKRIPQLIKAGDEGLASLRERGDKLLLSLPNLLDDSVPFGKSSEDNVEVRRVGEPYVPAFSIRHHGEIAVALGGADFERAVKVSGAGFYALKGPLVLMDLALQRLALDILVERGFTPVAPPFLMRRRPYEGVTDLADFENVMYKIEGDDLYLIATSEHPMAAFHMDEVISEDALPIKYAGVSACFRKEIGKHGLDERGLFRVHQFNKIEQFIFCKPQDSPAFHEELLRNSEDLLQKLKIPYRVVNVCTGDIGTVAAKKYDVEGWSPREQKYIELMSCSNCTDYQARRLNIRMGRHGASKETLHTLNNTMIATARALRIILEVYQKEDGSVTVPDALRPYMNGIKHLELK